MEDPANRAVTQHSPALKLTPDILSQYLLAEIAVAEGKNTEALQRFDELVGLTASAQVAQRAMQVALFQQKFDEALKFAKQWRMLSPAQPEALRAISGLSMRVSDETQAYDTLSRLLADEKKQRAPLLLWIGGRAIEEPIAPHMAQLVLRLTEPYLDMPEAHLIRAQILGATGQFASAADEAGQALASRPDWEAAVSLQAQAQAQSDPQKAERRLRAYLKDRPKALEAKLTLARLLVSEKRYKEALSLFLELRRLSPEQPDFSYAAGVLFFQAQHFNESSEALKAALAQGFKDEDSVWMLVAEGAVLQQRWEDAIEAYGRVSGKQFALARLRIAEILERQNKLPAALLQLREAAEQRPELSADLLMVETQILRKAKQFRQAYDRLTEALSLKLNSQDTRLLYERALVAERLGQLAVAEQDLRKILVQQPKNALALNALGYMLADRTARLAEAKSLIQQAFEEYPEDPSILDSMGWVQFKLGNLKEAVAYLKQAYARQPEPEIAAHLGEVLWRLGDEQGARALWHAVSENDRQDEALRATMRRFNVEPAQK